MRYTLGSAAAVIAFGATFVFAGSVVEAQPIGNPDVFVLAAQTAEEVELIREVMGRPYDDSPRLPASDVSEFEVFFQAQTLFRKANQLAQEFAGAERLAPPALPQTEVSPSDTHTVIAGALEQVRSVKDALGIETQVSPQAPGSSSATGVFMTIIDTNRQLNFLTGTQITPGDVFDQVTLAVLYSAGILSRYGDTEIPDTPAFDGHKRPADVYERLLQCIDLLGEIAAQTDVQVLRLSSRRNIPDDIEPHHVYDIARIAVAGLAVLSAGLDGEDVFPDLETPERVFPTQVYLRAGILMEQLERIQSLL